MEITVNGETKQMSDGATVAGMIKELGLDSQKVAVERNLEIVPRSQYEAVRLEAKDAIEIVHFIGGGAPRREPKLMSTEPKITSDASVFAPPPVAVPTPQPVVNNDPFVIAGKRFHSRLLVGTGKYRDMQETKAATEASGAEIVTVALRRVNLGEKGSGSLHATLDPKHYTYLPNSAGCYTADEAVRTLRLARELGGWDLIKLEVIGDKVSLYPDVTETLKAAEILIREGFKVMAYTNDDPIAAKKLEQMGCVAVMPLAAPIGSGLGIQNPLNIRLIVEQAKVPILVDAGVGTASDAAVAMELGCDGVLMNTAIAEAKHPVMMAQAMKQAVIAGRLAYLAGRMPRREMASASSPQMGLLAKG